MELRLFYIKTSIDVYVVFSLLEIIRIFLLWTKTSRHTRDISNSQFLATGFRYVP